MEMALYLLATLGILGAFDTLYYHEWRARLPALGKSASAELQLHAWRDFVYAALFCTLPWFVWRGAYAIALAALLLIEVVLTLWDFVVEDWIRKPLGGVYPGERIMHAIMGIVYGAMLTFLLHTVATWWKQPTDLEFSPAPCPEILRWALTVMGIGVSLSGVRDLYASMGLPGGAWPWKPDREASSR
ncbi:MAG TPA: hypothetical protein VKS01_05565 [Bryobacteraceae bacterium]|nr:hypothetical protein [Bryobacteraceae bacterium]